MPEHRNKGLGSSLLDRTCEYIRKAHDTHTIYAHTLKPRVFRLLKRMGWESTGKVPGIFFVKKSLASLSSGPPE
jgi:GNAT superfamily N-acetyltransferase